MSAAPVPFRRLSLPEQRRQAERERSAELKRKRDIDRAAELLDRLEARMNALSRSIARLQRTKSIMAARYERIEDRVLTLISEGRLARLDGFQRSFTTRDAPAALAVDHEELVPDEYFREKLIREVDKNAVKQALAKGAVIAGVRLTQKVSLLRK